MKFAKKLFSLLLAIAMLFTITASIDLSANAATSHTQQEAVNWANAQIGKSLDQDGVYGAQCVDLIRYYYIYLGASPVGGNGCNYATNALPNGWSRIKYYSGFTPQPGDVAVWTYASSSYGHVAIVTSANSSNMNVVEQNGSTHVTRSHSYNYSYGTFWGVIRPDFKAANIGNMTMPTISIDRTSYYVGDKINISWDKTSANTDFYQYWLIINNTTNGKEYFAGATGSAGNVHANSYSFKIPTTGNYLITVYSVPYNNKDTRQKVATKVFNANTNEMTNPIITLNKNNYSIGEKVDISWTPTSSNTDFYQYWLVIRNTTEGKTYYGGATGNAKDVNANFYSFTIPTAGDYQITVYSVPYYDKDSRQKVTTKTFSASTSAPHKHTYNNNGTIVQAATCTLSGSKAYMCSGCNTIKTETIPATGHSYDAGKVTKAPTATTAGVKTYTCTKCKATKTETIKALGLKAPTLKATVNTNGSFKLSWNKVDGATRYGIYMLQDNGTYKWIKSTAETSWSTGVAQYGKKYTYKVFAVDDKTSMKSPYSKAVSATNNKKLQSTTAKVTVNSNGSFKISWNKVAGATKYGIYMKQTNGSYKWIKTVTGTSWTTGTAQYNKQYSYKVLVANNNKSAQTFSNVVNAKNTKKLQTPSLKVAVNKNGSFKLSWGKVTGATSYQIYMKQSNGTYKLIKTTSSTSFTTAVAAKGKTYSYKVRAVTSKNKNATSNYSKVVSAKRK